MGRRILLRIFILNLQIFLLIVTVSVYLLKLTRVEAGFQPSESPTNTPSAEPTQGGASISPTVAPITETPTTTPNNTPSPTMIPTISVDPEPSIPAATLTPTPPSTTSVPESTATPTPELIITKNDEPPLPPPVEESPGQKSEEGAVKSVINKIIDPIKEIFKEEPRINEEPTPINYPEIESQWNTQETYYLSNRIPRKISNLLLSLAGGLISGGFSLWFEPKLPFEYLSKLRKGNIYRAISRIFL